MFPINHPNMSQFTRSTDQEIITGERLPRCRPTRYKRKISEQISIIPSLSILTSIVTMPTQFRGSISDFHLSSSSSLTIFIQKLYPSLYPPLTLINHPSWFLDNADLFLSHNEILFGLHQDMFLSSYFSTILQTIEPGQTAARGTTPTFPISCNDISQTTLHSFILLRYHPRTFTTTRDNWLAIRSLALKWGFTQVIVRSIHELKHLNRLRLSSRRRQSFNLASPHVVNTVQLQQLGNQHVQVAITEDVEERSFWFKRGVML